MRVSVKWLGVLVSAALLTIVTFTGLSRLAKPDTSTLASISDIPIDTDKTVSLALDEGGKLFPSADLPFLNNPKPSNSNYKSPQPVPDSYSYGFKVYEPDKLNPPKPSFDVSINFDVSIIDDNPLTCGGEPLTKRFAPTMPNGATKSGHCTLEFQLSKNGRPLNVKTKFCSEKMFAQPSVKAVQRWFYSACNQDDGFNAATKRNTFITYRLLDENGEIIPE